jgi:hypothetical protein
MLSYPIHPSRPPHRPAQSATMHARRDACEKIRPFMGEALPLCTPNAKESSILAAIGWQREWLAEVPFPFSPNEYALPISQPFIEGLQLSLA